MTIGNDLKRQFHEEGYFILKGIVPGLRDAVFFGADLQTGESEPFHLADPFLREGKVVVV